MKLADLAEVSALQAAMRRNEEAIAAVEMGYVTITLGGKYQDEAMAAATSAAMLAELKGRKAAIIRQLSDLGVSANP